MKRRYPLAIFLGAFLLFLVQPMAGKRVLPRFGGGPSVWTACMLFFQILLLAGYAYAHALTGRLSRRAQGWVHLGVIGIALLFLPLFASPSAWTSGGAGTGDPVRAILIVLAGAVGLPYFLLAATGPLLQAWYFSEPSPQTTSPYRLYALSSIASFLALLMYPVLIEPWLALRTQAWIWCGLFGLYAAAMVWCAIPRGATVPRPVEELGEPVAPLTTLYWLALAACGSTLLLAATSHICQEVAVIPFLWIVPLSLYLLTFVLCFDNDRWYNRRIFGLLAAGAIAANCYMSSLATQPAIWKQAAADLMVVLAGCMICHGELARSRPAPGRLTQFYLTLAAGGALGGVFTALVAPRIFSTFTEFPLAMEACCLLGLAGWWRSGVFSRTFSKLSLIAHGAAAIGLLAAALGATFSTSSRVEEDMLLTTRNFFGVLHVSKDTEDYGMIRKLTHGRTLHGLQFQDEEKRHLATTYYGPASGIGIAIDNHPARFQGNRTLRLGMIGLGTGTIAAYGKPGDTIRFYEINPSVERISNDYFTYRKDAEASRARVDVILGDARVKLEEQAARGESQQFDILAVDAFSSDSIPVHLLTAECATLYKYHLKPDGLLALHLSNRWLDLKAPARGLAHSLGWRAGLIDSDDESGAGIRASTWVIVSGNSTFFKMDAVRKAITEWSKEDRPPLLWRDDFTSLWPVFLF